MNPLPLLAESQIALGKSLAWIYRRFHRHANFDHRFDYLRGPDFWYWQERGILGAQQIKPGMKVLDIGCGDGFYDLTYFSAKAGHIDAIDLDDRAIALAKSRNRHRPVCFSVGNVVTDPFPDSEYDLILSFSTLQQIEELAALLLKIRRALKPSGLFFGSVSLIPGNPLIHTEQDVRLALAPHFFDVQLYSSQWPDRVECYFAVHQ